MIYWPAKRPGAALDYKFDLAPVLEPGETIVTANVTASGVTVDNQSHDTSSVSVKVSAGILGTPGVLVCAYTTSVAARGDEETAILPIGEEPVSLDMAKRQVRAEGTTADDDYLLELIQSAREHAEAYCGIRIAPAAVRMTFASFAALERLSQAPVQSIVDLRYLDAAGVEQVLDASVYERIDVDADVLRPRIRLAYGKSWPAVRSAEDAVRVSAVVGYTAVPRPVIRAMLLLISQWFDIRLPVQVDARGTPAEIPNAVSALLANYRR